MWIHTSVQDNVLRYGTDFAGEGDCRKKAKLQGYINRLIHTRRELEEGNKWIVNGSDHAQFGNTGSHPLELVSGSDTSH
jgi:hypothetical protein